MLTIQDKIFCSNTLLRITRFMHRSPEGRRLRRSEPASTDLEREETHWLELHESTLNA